MAPIDADRVLDEQERAIKHGQMIKQRRLDLGLKRPAFVAEVARQGQDMSADYLNKIESGARALANVVPELREAIRAVLGYSPEKWQELTGLFTPALAIETELIYVPRRGGPPIPPVVPFRETPISIPHELLQMVEKHGEDYPILKTERMQRMLAAPRAHGGLEVGPQTAKDWFEYWIANMRFLT